MPVPASRMIRVDPDVTSTQLVFPPTAAVSGPGDAMLPRTPQNLIRILLEPPARRDALRGVCRRKMRENEGARATLARRFGAARQNGAAQRQTSSWPGR